MLGAIANGFLGLAFIAKLAVGWLVGAFGVIRGRPIRAITAKMPSIAVPLPAISTSHLTPPYIVGIVIIALIAGMSRYMLSGRIGVWEEKFMLVLGLKY